MHYAGMMNPTARVLFLVFYGVVHPVGCPYDETVVLLESRLAGLVKA